MVDQILNLLKIKVDIFSKPNGSSNVKVSERSLNRKEYRVNERAGMWRERPMRKLLTFALVGSLVLAALPTAALAWDTHAARNVWAGVGIGIGVATLGGLLLGAVPAPIVAPPPPVIYTPPPVVYAPPPPVVYSPPPIGVYPGWVPPGHWKYHRHAGFRRY
jgi:hypothetical protein